MSASQRSFTCLQCRLKTNRYPPRRLFHAVKHLRSESPNVSTAPKVAIDIKHIRQNAALYEQNALERNYVKQSKYPYLIKDLIEGQWQTLQNTTKDIRVSRNKVMAQLGTSSTKPPREDDEMLRIQRMTREQKLEYASELKQKVAAIELEEDQIMSKVNAMAVAIPNLTSPETPRGDFKVVGYINEHPDTLSEGQEKSDSADRSKKAPPKSHTDIGAELGLLDFAGAGKTSGWGWYYLLNEAADLEQALIQYALSVARSKGWEVVSPPSMVYSHIAGACGFQPRDQNGEQQVYSIQQSEEDQGRKPELCLAGTAEIPLAGMKASSVLEEENMPLKRVAVSRCYRAEAGARGIDTKGLYRVHEFTKVEMFAWTLPDIKNGTEIFDEMLQIQTEILTSLNLHCRILEMPSTDLGASAYRKKDIEAYFPSRQQKDEGWGEVTSTSICTDYQTRRLATRVTLKSKGGSKVFPYTVNGTALAVPRVLAAILESGWNEEKKSVKIPECLWPWMNGKKVIEKAKS